MLTRTHRTVHRVRREFGIDCFCICVFEAAAQARLVISQPRPIIDRQAIRIADASDKVSNLRTCISQRRRRALRAQPEIVVSRRDGVATYIARASVATYAKGRRDNGATYDKHVKEVDNHHEKKI